MSQESEYINGYWDDARDVCRLDNPVVLFGDHTQVVKYIDFDFVVGADGVKILKPKAFLEPKYLYYFVMAHRVPSLGYARHYRHIRNITIRYPQRREQQRIVAVLDEAFEGLDRARAYADSNLHDAKELYASILSDMLDHASESWIRMPVSDTLTRIRVAKKIKRRDYLRTGEFPIISQESEYINGYWNNVEDVISIESPVVIFGDHTRCFKFVDFDFVVGADGTQIMAPIEEIYPEFYYYALQAVPLEGKGYARHFTHLKKGEMAFPADLEEQREIASTMSDIKLQITTLSKEYEAKFADLDSLRQSLLQRAFAGKLT